MYRQFTNVELERTFLRNKNTVLRSLQLTYLFNRYESRTQDEQYIAVPYEKLKTAWNVQFDAMHSMIKFRP